MATLNLSANGPSIKKSYEAVVNGPAPSSGPADSSTFGQWAVYSVAAPLANAFQQDSGKESVLKVQSTGEGELLDLVEEFSDGRIQFAFVKVKDPNTSLPKSVLIAWCGEGVPERTKGYFTSHLAAVSKLLHGYHVQITARSDRDLTPESIVQKVADSSGSKYSGATAMPKSAGAPPPVASKPAFTPTRVGGGGSGFNPLGSRTRTGGQPGAVDEDGWGADAPQITRTQLEKVAPAYKPTKVNIADIQSQKEPSRYTAPAENDAPSDVVRGGYQPIGKVDIAAIRRQAKDSGSKSDDRPTVVKGAYEPVGKVDIAAIRAKAQGPSGVLNPPPVAPAATGSSAQDDDDDTPKSLAERSAAFSQSERLTTLPKPKVANKFGSGAGTFAGTKAHTPADFGPKPATAAPVGIASRTFADEGGKTPAQLWAEKKGRQGGGASVASPTPTGGSGAASISTQKSGEGGWKSSYSGKSWAPVQTTSTGRSAERNLDEQHTGQDERDEEPPVGGGVGAIRDRFKDTAPIGVGIPPPRNVPEPAEPSPPPMDFSSKPNAGAARGVPIPGLPTRPAAPVEDDDDVPAQQTQHVPPPPAIPRSPSPPTPDEMRSTSPIQVAMPVSRSAAPTKPDDDDDGFAPPPLPTQSISNAAAAARNIPDEPQVEDDDIGRAAAAATAPSAATAPAAATGGQRALVQYDYEKAEDNEVELHEGEYVTSIDMVDDDWWMGTNSRGESGLFPANYVELVAGEEPAPAPVPQPVASVPPPPADPPAGAASRGPTATAQYDYEAAEDNELGFPDGAKITGLEFPDDDWWFGHYNGKKGLFPANYVQLDE